jgi:hypothetical protein
VAEIGGGWFDYWGSNGGYECNAVQRGERFQRVFYGVNLANGISLQSIYVGFGGTSWGWLAAPVVAVLARVPEDRPPLWSQARIVSWPVAALLLL